MEKKRMEKIPVVPGIKGIRTPELDQSIGRTQKNAQSGIVKKGERFVLGHCACFSEPFPTCQFYVIFFDISFFFHFGKIVAKNWCSNLHRTDLGGSSDMDMEDDDNVAGIYFI